MKNILIYSKNTDFCDSSDIFCGIIATRDIISDNSLIIDYILTNQYNGLIIDAASADDVTLSIIKQIKCSEQIDIIAVFVPDGYKIAEFAKAGVTIFFTKESLMDGIRSVFGLTKSNKPRGDVFRRALNRLRSLAHSLDQGVLLMDASDRVTFANESALALLGLSSADINRKTLDEIFSTHPYKFPIDSPQRYEHTRQTTTQGKELTLDTYITPTHEDTEYTGCIVIFNKTSGQSMDRNKELELLKYQDKYHSTQQSAAFKKQMLVIKDEVSGIIADGYGFETYFKPLDVMSGDIYGTINIKDGRYLFYIVDAMGKGLSASVTALQSSSFINHAAEMSIIKEDFDFERTISSFTQYIRDRLMEEEALCAVFVLLDTNHSMMSVCNFGMPPLMVCDANGKIDTLRTTGLPIMRFLNERKIHDFSLEGVEKILVYSDGLSESQTREGELYFTRLPDALRTATTKKHLLKIVNNEIFGNDDDITFFFISNTNAKELAKIDFGVKSSPYHLGMASERINEFMIENRIEINDTMTMEFALGEMLMNAMEHGSFDITFAQKQQLIRSGEYDAFIDKKSQEHSDDFNKDIKISCSIIMRSGLRVLIVSISDTGNGFAVADIFKFHSFDGNLAQIDGKKYNGRGIFITDNLVDGLFYNEKGNTVHILKVLEN